MQISQCPQISPLMKSLPQKASGPRFARGFRLARETPRAPIEKTTLLLADDHAVVRNGLCALLEGKSDIQVIGQARNGREAVKLARTLRPDVILMDIAMPVLNGLEATRQILAANPAAKVLILSAHSDDEYIEHLIAMGAMGFLEKQKSAEFLINAIRAVAKGNLCFSPAIGRAGPRQKAAAGP
jgi:DNA-binding NarL/FixJ family response regulator